MIVSKIWMCVPKFEKFKEAVDHHQYLWLMNETFEFKAGDGNQVKKQKCELEQLRKRINAHKESFITNNIPSRQYLQKTVTIYLFVYLSISVKY